MNSDTISDRVRELRCEQPTICWRPSLGWGNACVRDIAHSGRCGWERECDCLGYYPHGGLIPWTCPHCGQVWTVRDSQFVQIEALGAGVES